MENEEKKVEEVIDAEEVAVVEVKKRKLSKKVLAIGGGILAALAIGAAFILTKDKDNKIIEPNFTDVTDIPVSTIDTSSDSETTEVE